MPKAFQKAILEKIIAKTKEYLATYQLEAAVGRAVRDFVGDEGHPSFRAYFAAAAKRLREEAEDKRESKLHELRADAARVAIEERRDDLLGPDDADAALEDYLREYHRPSIRH